jgi:uncharacterized protein involved in exopolysaccharide biosynthesis
MNDDHLPSRGDSVEPDVRLEMASGGTRRAWAIYSEDQGHNHSAGASQEGAWGFDLRDLLDLARRGRWHIAVWVLLFTSAGIVYIRTAPPVYHVVAQLLVVQRAVLSEQQRHVTGRAQFLSTQAEIISSPVVVEAALASLPAGLTGEFGEDPVVAVSESLSAAPIKGTNVLALSLAAPGPEPGVALLGSVIESYRGFVRDVEHVDHRQDLEVLRRREAEVREQLEILNAKYAEMRTENAMGSGEADAAGIQAVLIERLTVQLVEARTKRIALENELHALEEFGLSASGRETSLSREKLREELWRAEAEQAALEAQFTDKHRGHAEVSQKVESLRAQLRKAEELERRALERQLGAARSTEERLDEVYRAEVGRAKAMELRRMGQQQLEEEIAQVAAVHRKSMAMLRDAELTGQGLDEGRAKVAIHVLEAPMSPPSPDWPQPALVGIPCMALGVLFGLGTAWLRTDRGLARAGAVVEEARRSAEHPELARSASTGEAQERPGGFISGA